MYVQYPVNKQSITLVLCLTNFKPTRSVRLSRDRKWQPVPGIGSSVHGLVWH
jgi:hypothetical protein